MILIAQFLHKLPPIQSYLLPDQSNDYLNGIIYSFIALAINKFRICSFFTNFASLVLDISNKEEITWRNVSAVDRLQHNVAFVVSRHS
jgi:hypothetical protein